MKNDIYPGRKIGRWTVTEEYIKAARGEKKWMCRCDCGTERYVLERSLKHGGSFSCGCVRKENAYKAIAHDLTGQIFGELTVLHIADTQPKNGGLWWTCQCSCGNLYNVPGSLLVTGRRTRCSSNVHEKNYASSDIAGQRFHRLTALYPIKERGKRKSVVWHCRCDCGKEIDVAYNNLVYCNMRSCGCQKKEHDEKLKDYLVHIAGTSLDAIKSQKIPSNNTSGVKGVYFIKGKWVAKIVFQKKAYYLGSYTDFEDAVKARREAEDMINVGTVAHYNRWVERADTDPAWGKENPIEISVEKSSDKGISITFLPIMDE